MSPKKDVGGRDTPGHDSECGATPPRVMPALVAGTHALLASPKKDVGGRDKPGHDDRETVHPLIPAQAGTQSLRKMPAQAKIKASSEENWVRLRGDDT